MTEWVQRSNRDTNTRSISRRRAASSTFSRASRFRWLSCSSLLVLERGTPVQNNMHLPFAPLPLGHDEETLAIRGWYVAVAPDFGHDRRREKELGSAVFDSIRCYSNVDREELPVTHKI